MSRILIADDERPLLRTLGAHLERHGYDVDLVDNGEAAVTRGSSGAHDLAIVDVGLPGINGVEVVYTLRVRTTMPIIVLSARHEESWKIRALDAGADDYVTKPFAMGELLARLRAVARRAQYSWPDLPAIETADFWIDFTAKRATRADGTEIVLTPTQWRLVEVLTRTPDRLVSQRELLTEVWGPTCVNQATYVRQFMAQLRAKFEPDPARPRYFLTQPGLGVRFVPDLQIEADEPVSA